MSELITTRVGVGLSALTGSLFKRFSQHYVQMVRVKISRTVSQSFYISRFMEQEPRFY